MTHPPVIARAGLCQQRLSHAEVRKLLRVDLLIIDNFALQALDATDTADAL